MINFLVLGPDVCIENEDSIVNFGKTECGKVTTCLMHLKNKSDVQAIFQVHYMLYQFTSCICGQFEVPVLFMYF